MRRSLAMAVAVVTAAAGAVIGIGRPAGAGIPDDPLTSVLPTPPLTIGYLDFCHQTQADTVSQVDQAVALGLKDAGWKYIGIDDCWTTKTRDASGNLVTDPVKYPRGMKWLADYVHGKGMKLASYLDGGTSTCQGYPGSRGHWQQDMKLLASYGIDYVKIDYCAGYSDPAQVRGDYQGAYTAMLNSGRRMAISISAPAYAGAGGSAFNAEMGWVGDLGNTWRVGGDVAADFPSWLSEYNITRNLAGYAGPGRFNDPDRLIITEGKSAKTTLTEWRSQLSVWAATAAPMYVGGDLRDSLPQTDGEITTLKNTDVLAVDQDPLAGQGRVVSTQGDVDVISKPLANGDRALVFFNKGTAPASASVSSTTAGFPAGGTYTVKDLWSKNTSTSGGTFSSGAIPGHGAVMWRVTPRQNIRAGGTELAGAESGRCLDDPGSATANGTRLGIYDCDGGLNQTWTITPAGPVTLRLADVTKCLDSANGHAVINDCDGSSGQNWTWNRNGTLVANGNCLDVGDHKTTNLSPVLVWPCNAGLNQRWSRE
ncbi:ricin-type beta-trefoil lectin domain protein [Actinoallomurus acanthiterrae]